MVLLVWLLSCEIPPRPATGDAPFRDAYIAAVCRIRSTEACRDALGGCDEVVVYPTQAACSSQYLFSMSDCPGINDMFTASAALVQECVDALDRIDCSADELCDRQGRPTFIPDSCEDVEELVEVACASDPAATAEY